MEGGAAYPSIDEARQLVEERLGRDVACPCCATSGWQTANVSGAPLVGSTSSPSESRYLVHGGGAGNGSTTARVERRPDTPPTTPSSLLAVVATVADGTVGTGLDPPA